MIVTVYGIRATVLVYGVMMIHVTKLWHHYNGTVHSHCWTCINISFVDPGITPMWRYQITCKERKKLLLRRCWLPRHRLLLRRRRRHLLVHVGFGESGHLPGHWLDFVAGVVGLRTCSLASAAGHPAALLPVSFWTISAQKITDLQINC